MKVKKMKIQMSNNNNKLIIKNKSPKSKEEYLTKILSKKEFKSNKPPIKNINFYLNEKKSTSKVNLFDENRTKNNIIKKATNNKNKKRQNKFFKKKKKETELSGLNSDLNIYKIINSKDKISNKVKQSSSITADSVNSYISNTSNKISNNKYINLSHKNEDNIDIIKRKRLNSDLSDISSNQTHVYMKKENKSKIADKKNNNCINRTNNNKNENQIKKINMINYKFIKNIYLENKPIRNNITECSNNEEKNDNKIKQTNHKPKIHLQNNKNKNTISTNINNLEKVSKENNKDDIKEKSNIKNQKEDINNFINNDKNINLNSCNNRVNLAQNSYFIDLNNKNDNPINKDYYWKKNLNPVKKSLFSEHMNFLINHKENNKNNLNFNCNNNEIINNNCMKFNFDDILDSTDKKEYESKFINYDLGKTTGTSLSKDSFFLFGNKNNEKNKNAKIFNVSKNENLEKIEEKERTQEEIEKLAKEYLNMSKYWENRDEYYKQKINQTNTITTVIDDNNSNEDTIF